MPRGLCFSNQRETRQKTLRVTFGCNTHGMKFPTKLLLGKRHEVQFSRSPMQAFSPRCQFHKHICVTFS